MTDLTWGPSKEERAITLLCPQRGRLLTEVFQGLFNLLGCEVDVGIWGNERCVQPVIVVVTVDGVGS